jgi:TP901 family phage tail tape measure protein
MSVRTDVINLNVNINGNKAQNDLNNLRKKAADISFEMKGLVKGTAEYIAKAKELSQVSSNMDALKKQIGIAALNQKELTAELTKLKALRGSVAPFSKEFKEFSEQIKKVENRLYDVKNGVQGFASFFSKIKDEVKQFGVVAAGYLGFQFITSQFQNIIRGAGKMSDQLADLQRASGLTADEVKGLNDEFKTFDTRTNTETLRSIANIAARLGVGKDDIAGFTKEFDKLVVVLGDSLGDADAAATTLGKILNVFDGKITGDNISKLGNAIVSLDQSGVASGAFLADFAQRLSGVSKNANISLGSLLGLGAGLEETGSRVESASTAIQKVIQTIASDIPKAAKIAGVESKKFADTFAKAPQEAIIQFAEGLVKNKGSFAEITASFKDAGEEGARVVTTLSNIGNSGDLLRKRIAAANVAIKETSIINEGFALKNETFGATLDKLGKEFNKLVSSPGITNFLKGAVEGSLSFIKALRNLPQIISENKIALLTLTAGILLLNRQYIISAALTIKDSALKLYNTLVTRGSATATTLANIATAAYIVVTNLLTGRISLAIAAQRLWSIALSLGLGPLGVIVTLAGALAVAIGVLTGNTKRLTAEQRVQAQLQEKITALTEEEEARAKSLFNIIKSSNVGYDEKKKLLQQLIAINPEYLSGLTLENIKTKEGLDILDKYVNKLRDANKVKAQNSLILEKEQQLQNLENQNTSLLNADDKKGNFLADIGAAVGIGSGSSGFKLQANATEIKQLKADLETLYKNVKDGISNTFVPAASGAVAPGARPPVAPKPNKDNNEFDRLKADAQKFYKEIQDLKKRTATGSDNPEEEEINRVKLKYEELLNRAKEYHAKQLTSTANFNEEEKIIAEAQQRELNDIFKKFFNRRFEQDSRDEYENSLLARKEFADNLKTQVAREYADGTIGKLQYENNLKQIEIDEAADRITIAKDYSGTVKKAATDVFVFKKDLEKKTTDNEISESEQRKANASEEALSKAKRAILTSRPGSKARVTAQKALLQLQFDEETKFLDKKSELYLLAQQELNDALKAIDEDSTKGKIAALLQYAEYVKDALSSLTQFVNNREQAAFNREKSINDKKKRSYKDQLDNKLISQAQYDKKVAALQDEQDKREREMRRKQAKREKSLNIFQAIINTGSAIVEALPNIPLSIIAGILGGIQVAAIASTPLPELGRGNWVRDGNTHANGGINANIERNEAVISAAAMTDANTYTVTGTTAQITSALNNQAGGANWAGGAIVKKAAWLTDRPAVFNSDLPKIMEQGGIVRPISGNAGNASADEMNVLLRKNNQLLEEQLKVTKEKNERLHAVVSIKEYREQEAKYEASKKASSL